MFRASACFAFLIGIITLAATAAFLVVQVAGLNGLPGYILGFAIFTLIVTAFVMLLSAINDYINGASALLHEFRSRHRRIH